MSRRYIKFISLGAFGVVMMFFGSLLVGEALAQVSPLVCSGESAGGFSGWILCRMGMPADGIGGANPLPASGDTLFKGQRILSQKIDALALQGQDQYVYLAKGDSNPSNCPGGRCNLVKIGKLQTGGVRSDFSSTGLGITFPDNSGGTADTDVNGSPVSGNPNVFFIPIYGTLFSQYTKVVNGVTVYPSICQVVSDRATSLTNMVNKMFPVNRTAIQCSWAPALCNYGDPRCLMPAERMVFDDVYSAATPHADRYRILIQ